MPAKSKTSMIPVRSPVNLRSNSQNSMDQSLMHESQVVKLKSKSNKSKKSTDSDEISKLKIIIDNQKREFDDALKDLRLEINKKNSEYGEYANQFQDEIKQVKVKQSEISNLLYTLNATRFDFALPIGFNKPFISNSNHFSEDYIEDFVDYSKRISDIEAKIKRIDESLCNLNEIAVSNIMNGLSSGSSSQNNIQCAEDCVDRKSFTSEIECVNFELQRINTNILSNEENIKKMNLQLHVLSSKFINFNAKINDYFLANNRSNEASKIVDSDTLPFLVDEHQKSSLSNSNFCFNNSASNRFRNKFVANHSSNFVVVRVDFASVTNINKFVKEMRNQFENRVGYGTIKQISIINCKVTDNIIHQINLFVYFNCEMNHGQLNDMKFPTNWTFFGDVFKPKRSKRPMKSHRSIRTQQNRVTASSSIRM